MNFVKTKKQKLFAVFFIFLLIITGSFSLRMIPIAQAQMDENVRGFDAILSGNEEFLQSTNVGQINTVSNNGNGDEICPKVGLNPITWFNCILLVILQFLGILLSVAATIFNWIIKPENMLAVINNKVIYSTWAMVRDTLNIAFILVLLFSAFSTIFQVDKYSYKNLLRTLVIMALLVNFSYPIARFIIDFSNSMMYYLLNNLGLGDPSTIFDRIADQSKLAGIINPKDGAATNTAFLIASVIFLWIFTITILIIALLFIIRTIALAILIIFSSLAFTGSIIPFLSKYSSQWWDNLFKYAFFGPVMIFMLSVALNMMSNINLDGMSSMETIAGQQSSSPSIVAAMAFFAIPVIILWGGIMFAQSMSLAMGGAVIGRGQKFMKWAPNAIATATGVPGGVKKAADYYGKKGAPGFLGKIPGLRGSEKTEATEDRIAGLLTKGKSGWKNASSNIDIKKIAEAEEKLKSKELGLVELQKLSKTGNKFEQAAAIRLLVEKEKVTAAEMDTVKNTFGETSTVFKQLVNKVKLFDPTTAFAHIANDADRMTKKQEFANSNQFDAKKLNLNTFNDDEMMEIMIANGALSTKDITDISKGSPSKKTAINGVLARLIKEKDIATDETSQRIHLAHFAQTGSIADNSFSKYIFSKANEDMLSNITEQTAKDNTENIALYTKNLKKALNGIKNDVARLAIVDDLSSKTYISQNPNPEERNTENMNSRIATNVAKKDPQLRLYRS